MRGAILRELDGLRYEVDAGKKIGWGRLLAAEAAAELLSFMAFLKSDPHVLHWHGDTFDLPPGARRLASTEKYRNQAFALGDFALGLQFHLEVTVEALERWYVGHACELAKAGVDVYLTIHPFYDNAIERIHLLQYRRPGDPNIMVNKDALPRFLTIIRECTDAQLARIEPASASAKGQ